MIHRRSLLGIAAAGVASQAFGRSMPGVITRPETADLMDSLAAIRIGLAGPRIRVLFSPGCEHSAILWKSIRPMLGRAVWAWVPYGGFDRNRRACAAALALGGVEGLEAVLSGALSDGPDAGGMVRQDGIISQRLGRLLWESTNTAMATPTTVFMRKDGVYQAVRGSFDEGTAALMLGAAA